MNQWNRLHISIDISDYRRRRRCRCGLPLILRSNTHTLILSSPITHILNGNSQGDRELGRRCVRVSVGIGCVIIVDCIDCLRVPDLWLHPACRQTSTSTTSTRLRSDLASPTRTYARTHATRRNITFCLHLRPGSPSSSMHRIYRT